MAESYWMIGKQIVEHESWGKTRADYGINWNGCLHFSFESIEKIGTKQRRREKGWEELWERVENNDDETMKNESERNQNVKKLFTLCQEIRCNVLIFLLKYLADCKECTNFAWKSR